ncbi:MAG: ATP-binding protein [Proteobacteria bacterium]|nr:ATP-binding protein [Pseudomonadota bacterium]
MPADPGARVTIGSDLANLPKLQHALDHFGRQHGIPVEAINQLQVVLDELASNIIKYAWPDGAVHELSVSFGAADGAVTLEFNDDGAAFNPLDAPPPRPLQPGERPRPGGVGLHMVRQLVDGMAYARIGATNRITITKRLN